MDKEENKEKGEETAFERILREREEADAKKRHPKVYGLEEVDKPQEVLEKNIVLENNLQVVNELIRKHGIVQVGRQSKKKKTKLAAQERFLNVLDMLYEKAVVSYDVKAGVEYLNRTAGSVAQTFDLNQNKKKLIMMGNLQTEGEVRKKEYAEIVKGEVEEDDEVLPPVIDTKDESNS